MRTLTPSGIASFIIARPQEFHIDRPSLLNRSLKVGDTFINALGGSL